MLNNIDRDGTWLGYDYDLYRVVQKNIKIPLIGCGGANGVDDVSNLI